MRISSRRQRASQSRRTVVLFVASVLGALGSLVYFAFQGDFHRSAAVTQNFNELHRAFTNGGIEQFNREKRALRGQVEHALNNRARNAQAARDAEQIAVYLFPEVLPKDNFEKLAAMELWIPLQRNIEKAPRSAASRSWFEELRATIWNYESADRSAPTISVPAQQVLRIYGGLANP